MISRRCFAPRFALTGATLFAIFAAGCRDESPPPPRVAVPPPMYSRQQPAMRDEMSSNGDVVKPLPPQQDPNEMRPPFADEPLVVQQPPEQPAYVESYRRFGSPPITLFVNRTLEGNVIPVNPNEPIVRTEVKGHTSGNVEVRDRHGSVSAKGPVDYKESAAVYLQRGQYDEVQAKSLDYEAVEKIMMDWLAANGQVKMISPAFARQKLTPQQLKDLQSGQPQVLSEIAKQLGVDILVQVQAHPTRQTQEGLEVRMIAEAISTKTGQSFGRAVVDVPPPLEKTRINEYTRYLARKLMMDMTDTWNAARPVPPAPAREPEPQH